MAKLTDLFGRKVETGAEAPPQSVPMSASAAPSASQTASRPNGGSAPSTPDSTSDLGSRMGEENEALRNMLSDAGRKIGELDELKQAFGKLVNPFNATLRALEEEKSQTLSLSGMLAELCAPPTRRCVANSTIPNAKPPRSKPKPSVCARTSSSPTKTTGRSKAPRANSATRFPPTAPRSPSSNASLGRKAPSAAR